MSVKKILLIGDGGVGKTAIIRELRYGYFEKKYLSTVGAEAHRMEIGFTDVELWDISGNDKYAQWREAYFRNADAAVIMFDVTHQRSYRNVKKWYAEIQDASPGIPVIVIGNKTDDTANRKITTCGYDLPYFEMSVKNDKERKILEPLIWLTCQMV